jgi:hypothetical protein
MKTKQQMLDAQSAKRREEILLYATPPNDLYAANASDARRLVRLLELLGFTPEEPYAQTTINGPMVAPEIPLSELEALDLASAELNLNVRVAGAPDGRNVAAELRRFIEAQDAYSGLRALFESVKTSLPNDNRQTAEVILAIPAVLASVKRALDTLTA